VRLSTMHCTHSDWQTAQYQNNLLYMCCHRGSCMKRSNLLFGTCPQLDTTRAFHSRSHSRRSFCRSRKKLLDRRRPQHYVDPTRMPDKFPGQNISCHSTDISGTSSCRRCIPSNILEAAHRAWAASNSSRCWGRPRDLPNCRKIHPDMAQVPHQLFVWPPRTSWPQGEL
jgi:hypothetical protein